MGCRSNQNSLKRLSTGAASSGSTPGSSGTGTISAKRSDAAGFSAACAGAASARSDRRGGRSRGRSRDRRRCRGTGGLRRSTATVVDVDATATGAAGWTVAVAGAAGAAIAGAMVLLRGDASSSISWPRRSIGTRHSNASIRAGDRRHRRPALGDDAVGDPGRVARRAHGLRQELAHLALVAAVGLLDVGEQQIGAFARLHADRGFRGGARLGQFARVERGLGHGERGFGMVVPHRLQLACPDQPVVGRIAGPRMDIEIGDLGMRLDLPGSLEDLGTLLDVVLPEQRPRRRQRRRYQVGRQPVRLQRRVARRRRVLVEDRHRLGGEQDRALALGCGLVEPARRLAGIEQLQRAVPVAARGRFLQRRIRCPAELRRGFGGAAGIVAGGGPVAEPLGFEIQAAQAEQTQFRVVEHRLELPARRLVVAFEQRGLRVEEVDQRLLVGADELRPPCLFIFRASAASPGAGGDHAGRQRLVAAVAAPDAEIARDRVGARPDRLGQPPQRS